MSEDSTSNSERGTDSESGINENEQNYHGLLEKLSKKWINVQLTHRVSATAANSFWKLAVESFPPLSLARQKDQVKKNVPCLIHQRRKLYKESCPVIHMTFVYLNRSTQAIENVQCKEAPTRKFPKNKYLKLYEEAHIKVYFYISYIIYNDNSYNSVTILCIITASIHGF